jgi:hypothetical protein
MSEISKKALSEAELLKEIYKKLAGDNTTLDLNKAQSKATMLRAIAEVTQAPAVEPTEPDIKVASGTIPAIDPDTRVVVQVDLGIINKKEQALVGFFPSSISDSDITKGIVSFGLSNFLKVNTSLGSPIMLKSKYLSDLTPIVYQHYLLVFEDYTRARRAGIPSSNSGNAELYNDSVQLPKGYSYSDINVGVLCGWYSFDNSGTLSLDKKVQMESSWLTQSGDNTILNIALKNVDALANTSKDFKVAVYE